MDTLGYDFEDVEDIMIEYGGTINMIYSEMGIKAGFRLQTELLCNSIKSNSERGDKK